jgi:hypothetical protein
VSFVYGQTRTDVVRVTVRTVDGREFEVETIAAPVELAWNARSYVAPIPVDLSKIDTVRGYDASGQYVGGDRDARETGPPPPSSVLHTPTLAPNGAFVKLRYW